MAKKKSKKAKIKADKVKIESNDEKVNADTVVDKKEAHEEVTHVAERGTGSKKIPGHIIIQETDDEKARWYVVHTTSGHEIRVAETLRQRVETMSLMDRVFELLVPT